METILNQVTRGDKQLVSIDFAHHEVHEGDTFETSYKSPEGSDLADNATILILIRVGDKAAHLTWLAALGGDAEVEFFERVTVSVVGTALPQTNMNRTSNNVRTVLTYLTPTITNYGTRLSNYLLPGGTGGQTMGGTARQETEWILKTNYDYVLRLTNRAGSNQPGSVILQWYEHNL